MDTDLIDRLTTTAADAGWGASAAIWLLAEHGHWLPILHGKQLIHHFNGDHERPYVMYGVALEARLIATDSEHQVLAIAASLANESNADLGNLTSLDEQNVRLVLHAIAWTARGRAWAEGLNLNPTWRPNGGHREDCAYVGGIGPCCTCSTS